MSQELLTIVNASDLFQSSPYLSYDSFIVALIFSNIKPLPLQPKLFFNNQIRD
jgi:hypothetical protein